MKNLPVIYLFFFLFSIGNVSGILAQSNNYKPGPNKMVINLEASTQKFELPVKDVKTKVNNELTYHWYKSDRILQTKGGYDGKLLHGVYAEFYLNNNLKEKGVYKKGLKNGEWKTWYENGQLKEVSRYCHGLNHGKFQVYNEKGELTLLANYKKGKLHGEMVSYESGKILAKHKYKKGNEVFPKPEKIRQMSDGHLSEPGAVGKKFNWKFWQKESAPGIKPAEKQPKEQPSEKEKEPVKEKKEPGKKSSPKDTKTSSG